MEIDSQTLFLANATILTVLAFAFAAAYHSQERARHWLSWMAANILLAISLVLFTFEPLLPPVIVGTVAHGLLFLGFGLRLKAAAEFAGRTTHPALVFAPGIAFLGYSLLPVVQANPAFFFATTNYGLAAVTALVFYEFWKDRADKLPSRMGLLFVYAIMAGSFGVRALQGTFAGEGVMDVLPKDGMLVAHLIVALVHTVGSGAFAVSIAYEQSAKTLKRDARSDALTGLANRRGFEEHLQERLTGQARTPFALILFDVDHFKAVNDRHGHATGDAALKTCAAVLRQHVRTGDHVARIGGEEFAAVLDGATDAEAWRIAERVREALGASCVPGAAGPVDLTVSAGIYSTNGRQEGFDDVMRRADKALYRAKHMGRNRTEKSVRRPAAA